MNILTRIRSKAVGPAHIARQSKKQTGQSTVEIALTLPLLLLVLFGIIVSVFIFYAFIQVSNAAREGARAGSVYRSTMNNGANLSLDVTVQKAIYDNKGTVSPSDDVTALGSLSTSSPSFNVATDVVCTLNGSPCSYFDKTDPPHVGDQLAVQVTYRYTMPVLSAALPMFPQPIVLVRTVVMEVQ